MTSPRKTDQKIDESAVTELVQLVEHYCSTRSIKAVISRQLSFFPPPPPLIDVIRKLHKEKDAPESKFKKMLSEIKNDVFSDLASVRIIITQINSSQKKPLEERDPQALPQPLILLVTISQRFELNEETAPGSLLALHENLKQVKLRTEPVEPPKSPTHS